MENVISFTPAQLVAFITAIGGAIVTIIATLSSNKAHDCVIDEIGNMYIYDTINSGANLRGFIAS